MATPLHKRSLKSLQAKLERALQAGATAQIHAAATNLAHPASVQSIAGWPALCLAGAAFARLAAREDAPPFTALDAALCFRAGVAEDERAQTAVLAAGDAPEEQPAAELYARWALAGRWRDLAALPEPHGQVAEGAFGVASGDVALALWHRARREGLPLAPLAAEAEREAEREAWNRVRNALRPLYETLHACRANLLWLSLVGQLTETREDGALATRLRRAGWRFWSARVDVGDPHRRLLIHDLDGISDGAPEWVRARRYHAGAGPPLVGGACGARYSHVGPQPAAARRCAARGGERAGGAGVVRAPRLGGACRYGRAGLDRAPW